MLTQHQRAYISWLERLLVRTFFPKIADEDIPAVVRNIQQDFAHEYNRGETQ